MGKVEAIWIKRMKRGPMDPVERATLIQGRGIEGNANQGGWRQVTLIEKDAFEQVTAELGIEVDPAWRRANVMVSGLSLSKTRGRVLHVGGCRIEIRGETRPCEKMDETLPGLQRALEPSWRGGAFGTVIEGGEIRIGDSAEWI
jgi:MOSC domain-containing protein YiiM